MYVGKFIYVCTYIHTLHMSMHVCICIYVYMYIGRHEWAYMCVYMYMNMHVIINHSYIGVVEIYTNIRYAYLLQHFTEIL